MNQMMTSPLSAAVPGRDAMRSNSLFSIPSGPAAPYSFAPNPNSSTYANDVLESITRDQYADYLRNFYGIEQRLLDYATDSGLPMADAMKAAGRVEQSFDRLPGQIDRRQRRMGLTMDADQQAELDRQANLAEGRATGMAANRAAARTYDRQNAVLAGNQSAATEVIRGLEASP